MRFDRPATRSVPSTGARLRPGGDAGAGSVLVLAILLVVFAALTATVWLATALHAQARLRTAADLAALAGADQTHLLPIRPGDCPDHVRLPAVAVSAANGARLTGCRTDAAQTVTVTVEPGEPVVRGSPRQVRARAGLPARCQMPPVPAADAPPRGGLRSAGDWSRPQECQPPVSDR